MGLSGMIDTEKASIKSFIALKNILEEMDKYKEYILEADDRTFANRVTENGFKVDGAVECFNHILKIVEKNIAKTEFSEIRSTKERIIEEIHLDNDSDAILKKDIFKILNKYLV